MELHEGQSDGLTGAAVFFLARSYLSSFAVHEAYGDSMINVRFNKLRTRLEAT